MAKRIWIGVMALAACLAGCTPLRLLDAIVPSGGYVDRQTHAYGEHARHAVDVYRPAAALREGAAVPVVVYFYGGRWQASEKREFRFVGEALSSRGYLAILPDYRPYPEVVFPAFVEDAARAVKWAREHARELGGDPAKLVLMGHSAGAHQAMMLALDQRYLAAQGLPAGSVKAAVGMSGPYDFLPFRDEDIKQIMGPEANWPQTQPVRFVDAADPPLLLQYGLKDEAVWVHNGRNLRDAVHKAGGRATLLEYGGLDHHGPVLALAAPLRLLGPVLEDAASFIDQEVARASTM